MKHETYLNLSRFIALIMSLLTGVLSLAVLISWQTGQVKLIQINTAFPTIQYNTGLLFLLSSLAMLSHILTFDRYSLSRWLGFVIGIFGFLTLIEYIGSVDLGIDQLFFKSNSSKKELYFPGRMSPLTAVAFVCQGLIFVLLSYRNFNQIQSSIIFILTIIVLVIGIFGTFSNFTAIETNLGISHAAGIAILTTISILLTSIGILAIIFYYSMLKQVDSSYIYPFLLGFGVLFFCLLEILGLWNTEIQSFKSKIQEKTDQIAFHFSSELQNHTRTLIRAVKRIESGSVDLSSAEWQEDALALIDETPAIQQVFWLNSSLDIKDATPQEGLNSFLLDFVSRPKIQLQLLKIPPHQFLIKHRDSHLLFFVPAYEQQKVAGYLVCILNSHQFFDHLITPLIDHDYYIQIWQKSDLVYQYSGPSLKAQDWVQKVSLNLPNASLVLKVFPTSALIKRNIFLWLFLIGSFFLSLLLGALTYLWQLSQKNLSQIQKISQELLENQQKLDLALKSAEMGVWSYDLHNNQIFWDSFSSQLFGFREGSPSIMNLKEAFRYVSKSDKHRVSEYLKPFSNTAEFIETTLHVIPPQQSSRYLMMKGSVYPSSDKQSLRMTGVCWDITEHQRNLKLLEVQLSIGHIILESSSIEKAIPKILEIIGKNLNWDIATFWMLDDSQTDMHCVDTWHSALIPPEEAEKTLQVLCSQKDRSFLEEIKNRAGPVWAADIHLHPIFSSAAEQLKVKGAFGFPILVSQHNQNFVYAVIKLLSREPFNEKVDDFLINLTYALGNTIGLFIQQRRNEEAQALLASLVQFSTDAIISMNTQGVITSWNHGAEEIFHYSAKEVIGNLITLIYPKDKLPEFDERLKTVNRGDSIKSVETIRVRKNGEKFWASVTLSPLKNSKGEIIGSCSISRDISALKKVEENFRSFIETTNDWIWSINQYGKVTFSNIGIKTILGYTPEEILDTDISFLLNDENKNKWKQELQNYINKRKGWVGLVHEWKHKNGSIKWLESNAEIISNSQGDIIGFRGADRDITERIQVDRIKNEFISIVSHELRTPLTSIRGSIGLIMGKAKNELSERTYHLLEIAYHNCERLIRLINEILDIEKMESGKIEMHFEPLKIDDLIRSVVEDNQAFAEKLKIDIVVEELTNGAMVYGNADRLFQVISNLLSNAIKFSNPSGRVFIHAKEMPTSIRVSIKDEGIGIPDSFKPQIFKKFSQADTSSSRALAGTGLGLNICKNIIEKHGGTIQFTSQVGKGSTFYFDLPKHHASTPLSHSPTPAPKDEISFLLVHSPDESFVNELKKELVQQGLEVEWAQTLEEAVNLVKQRVYNAAIIDDEEINSDKIALIKEIYSQGLNPHLPIILISRNQFKETEKMVPILGWLDKQSSPEQIAQFINEIKKKMISKLPHILYIEDDIELVEVVSIILRKERLLVTSVATLKEAREKLSNTEFDLIILDLILPDGLGSELLPCFNPRTKEIIPVIIFSAKEEDQKYGNEVKKYFVKSRTTEEELVQVIKSIIKSKDLETVKENYDNQTT